MFSDLAFVDWIALIFAALLLAAAAAAALVAYATAKSRPARKEAVRAHSPRHAAGPAHASTPTARSEPVTSRIGRATNEASTDVRDGSATQVLEGSGSAVLSDGVLVESSAAHVTSEERVAARAAKLRKRPIPDHARPSHKRIVSTVEPKRMPAHAPNRAFQEQRSDSQRLTMGTDSTEGFAARTPGFFEDPVGRHELRYWDGHRWTEYVKEHGERFTDPL